MEFLASAPGKKYRDELLKNNLGIVIERAQAAARTSKGLSLEEKKKIGFEEFLSGYLFEYNELINTYNPAIHDNFGAYAAGIIRLRYNQILNKAKDNLDREGGPGTTSIEVNTSEGLTERPIADQTDTSLEAFENRDLSMRTQIDVRKGKAVLAPKLKFVRNQTDFNARTNDAIISNVNN